MPEASLIWRVNRAPRFPLLSLGEYLAAEDGPRETMRRRMKFERLAPTLLYRKVQAAVARFLAHPTRPKRILDQCRTELEDERVNAITPTAADNALYAIRALDTFERSLNALPLAGLVMERAPLSKPMLLETVKVSVQPTAFITINRPRGKPLKGAIIVDNARGVELKTDEARARATQGMDHATYLLHEHVAAHVTNEHHKSSPEHCLVFHSYRGELRRSPDNYRRALENTKAACRVIAAGWDSIEPPSSFDPNRARYRD